MSTADLARYRRRDGLSAVFVVRAFQRVVKATLFLGALVGNIPARAENEPARQPGSGTTSQVEKPSTIGPDRAGVGREAATPASNQAQVVLLRGGRTVQGIVSRNGENYTIRKPTGEMFLPANQVIHVGGDLRGIYRYLRDTLPGESPPDEHFALAKWCLEKQLLSDGRFELLEVLRHDSTREDARVMLTRLDTVLDGPDETDKKLTADEAQKSILRAKYGLSDLQALGGLSRDQSRAFSTRVLPILLNNCSGSGCHGNNSTAEFQLIRLPVLESGRKQVVARNLEHVLALIDRAHPDESLLLVAKTGPHARAGRTLITGTKGNEQLRIVRDWIASLSTSERTASTSKPSVASRTSRGTVRTAASEVEETPTDAAVQTVSGQTDSGEAPSDEAGIEPAGRTERAPVPPAPVANPFDPSEFNDGLDLPR